MFSLLCLISIGADASTSEGKLNWLKQNLDISPVKVIEQIKLALEQPTNSKDLNVQLNILLSEGYRITGEFQKSYYIAQKVVDNAIKGNYKNYENIGRFWLATAKLNQGDYQSALQDYSVTAIFFEGNNNKTMHARSLMGKGNSYAQLGQYKESLEYFNRALKLFQQTSDKKLISFLLNNIGSVHFWINEYDTAILYYQKAIDALININNKEAISRYYSNIGEAYTELQNYDEAEKVFIKALDFSGENEVSYSNIIIHLFLGKLKLKTNDNLIATSYFDKVIRLADSAGSKNWKVEALLGKSNALQSKDFPSAIKLALDALSISKSIDKMVFIKESHKLLSHLYKKTLNFEKALFHNEQFNQLNQKSLEQDKQSELVKLSSRIEITQKDHQIELLEKNNALQEATLQEQKTKQYIVLIVILSSIMILFQWYRRQFHKKQSRYLTLQVEAQTKNIKSLSDIGREITSSLDLTNVSNIVYRHIKDLFDADVFSIGLYNKEQQTIDFPITIEKDLKLDAFSMSMTETDRPAVQCVFHCHEVLIGQLPKKGNVNPSYEAVVGVLMESVAYIPLFIGSNIIGCITIQRQALGGFDEYQLDMMRTISAYTAIAIDNALTHECLKEASNTDFLTLLPNRRAFIDKAQYQLEICQRNNTPLSFAISDIDKFKLFNDTYGHDGGDYVLKEVAKLFQNELRKQDLVARWGGEEFVFMLPNTDLNAAENLLEKIRVALANQSYEFSGKNLSVTSTFGVTQVLNCYNIDELIDTADSLLYKGKQSGRNKVMR